MFPTPDARVETLLTGGVPRFSDAEMARRRAVIADTAAATDCDLVLVYGADRSGSAVPWITGWQVTREAAVLVDLVADESVLFVQYHNHVPLAGELARGCDVRWGGPSTADTLVEELTARGAGARRLGVIGPLRVPLHARLTDATAEVVDLGGAYTRARLIKSEEELDWLRVGAYLSDRAAVALRDGVRPGIVDHELADLIERAYVPLGGTTHIHYLGITSMDDPSRGVPAQLTTGRVVDSGDAVVAELSAAFDGYAGQVLRTISVDRDLTPRYAELHAVADAAFDAVCDAIRPGARPDEVVDAAGLIEDAGFTVVDDLVHGYGGGYLPPVLGSKSRPAGPLPDLVFEAGMTVVVQPNVTTLDHKAGVQTGELVEVTADGVRSLHGVPRGPWRSGGNGDTGVAVS